MQVMVEGIQVKHIGSSVISITFILSLHIFFYVPVTKEIMGNTWSKFSSFMFSL